MAEKSFRQWLQSINLDQYLSDFTRAGYTTIEQCSGLTEEKLQQLGITMPGHKKRILAYLPKIEDFMTEDTEDHIYGNVDLPAEVTLKDTPKTGFSSHTYVNTPSVTSDPIYGNIENNYGTSSSPRNVNEDIGAENDSESLYDVLPPLCQIRKKVPVDAGDYVNIAAPQEGAVGGVDSPPFLPPKTTKKSNRSSIDEAMGLPSPLDENAKRPVPKPRTSVGKRKDSIDSTDSSPVSATSDLKGLSTPPLFKPLPKPRPRPAPRGRKLHSGQDSASPSSSTSNSPRHSSNASPVTLLVKRDVSPDMPREHAPPPPQLDGEKQHSSRSNVQKPSSVCEPLVPTYKPQLSMETEVPPADVVFMCNPVEVKVPLPKRCFNNNEVQQSDSDRGTIEETSWIVNDVYGDTSIPEEYNDPDNPQKLDDFIKSLIPQSPDQQKNTVTPDKKVPKEDSSAENEEFYQVPLPVVKITTKKPCDHSERKSMGSKSNSTTSLGSNTDTPPFSTVWNNSNNIPNNSDVQEEVDKSERPVSSESIIDREKHDSVYGHVWFATSGKTDSELNQDLYDEVETEKSAFDGARKLTLSTKKKYTLSESTSISSRDSSLSFNVPEPTFTPPPLPPGTELESFTTSQNPPPPAIPPRPRNASGLDSKSSSVTSLTSVSTTNSNMPASLGGLPDSDDHRGSIMSFSDLAFERADTLKREATENEDDRYEVVEVSTMPKTRKLPRPPLTSSMRITRRTPPNRGSFHLPAAGSLSHRGEADRARKEQAGTPRVPTNSCRGEAAVESNKDTPHNVYSPEPFNLDAQPRCPPAPPPRVSQLPLRDLFNHTGHHSPVFRDDMSDITSMGSVWESDDTLSDGGDFYESSEFFKHHKPISMPDTIPFLPSSPSSIKDKKGVCYKYGSLQSRRRGWHKRWVQFDGKTLKYFHDEKSHVSKRIIPVSSMVNVKQDIKNGEIHGYGFKVITVDRVYSFSVDDADELALWTCLLMKSIIDNDDNFIEGGDMSNPDLEGFIRMEGVKGKRYLTIKGDLLAYYNTYNDYKAGCPIHIIQMKLASVKATGKKELELRTPYASYGLNFDSNEELVNWKNALEESITEGLAEDTVLNEVYENHSNRHCADCGAPNPHWASVNLGITVCKHCAGIHRMLTMPFSKVRSLRMDVKVWTPTLIKMTQQLGNDNANNFWEWNSNEEDRIDSDTDINDRRDYIVSKYEEKKFCRLHPLHNDQSAMDDALCKSVQYGDVFETMQLIFSGADILCTTNQYGGEHVTPCQLARKAKQTIQMEFLYQNGAEGSGEFPASTSIRSGSEGSTRTPHLVKIKGYLLKTGPNLRDFHKRWCILEHGIFTYFENEKSLVAKDSIMRHEMISLAKVQDERQEYAFELGTTKSGGRVYLFAAENFDDRQKWIVKLAKSFAPLPVDAFDQIRDLDRAGVVFLREGATTDWQMTWIQLKGKCLSIFNKGTKSFEDIDLRKIRGIKSLNVTDGDDEIFQDKSPPFVIDLPKRALYIKGDAPKETKSWLEILEKITSETGGYLIEQQLTVDEVPVIVDKCINYISTHGVKTEGIYRKNGVHSKVTNLVKQFKTNARGVHLRLDDYDVHDVATTLKRFFRSLEEPLLTTFLYAKWTNTCNIGDFGAKMQWYKYLLGELPTVHYSTLKRVISHLARLTDYQDENKMTKINLASIFGPVLMNPEKDDSGEHNTTTGFGATQQEISVVLDLLDNNLWLFEVKDDEVEHERKMQEAMEKIQIANEFRQAQAGDLLMGVYVHNREGHAVTLKVSPDMTSEVLLEFVTNKAQLDPNTFWGLFEVVCDETLERPIHFLEKVLDVTLRWTEWPDEFCKDNYLVVKENHIYENVDNVFDPHFSLFEELKYSDKKGFKKFCFEFSQFKLTYQKDPRATSPINSWNVEDLILYVGADQKRSPPTKNALTFILHKEKVSKTRDTPFFGHSLCFNTSEDQYRWLAAMLHAQHPGGLTRDGVAIASGSGSHGLDTQIPSPHLTDSRQAALSRAKTKASFITRLIKR